MKKNNMALFIGLLALTLGLGALGGFFWSQQLLPLAWACFFGAGFLLLFSLIWWIKQTAFTAFHTIIETGYDVGASSLWHLGDMLKQSFGSANPRPGHNEGEKSQKTKSSPVQGYERALSEAAEIRRSLKRVAEDLHKERETGEAP